MSKRRLFAALTTALLLISMALPLAMATETQETTEETTEETKTHYSLEKSGSCGKNTTWQLEGHTLTISGSGEIDAGSPWEFYKDSIHKVILKGDITVIGAEAFSACNNLQYIDFGNSLKEIGYRAFYSCNALEAVRMPDSFRKFDTECFLDCDGLQLVYCDGPMPSFKGSCLYTNHTVQVFYSPSVPWPYEETSRLMTNFGGRVHVDVGSPEALEEYWEDIDTDEPEETKPVLKETQPPETEPPVTVPETTVPVTTAATVPETTSVETAPQVTETAPPATEAVATAPALELSPQDFHNTEPTEVPQRQTPKEKPEISGVAWALIAAAAFTAILVLALLIRMIVHGGGRYSD